MMVTQAVQNEQAQEELYLNLATSEPEGNVAIMICLGESGDPGLTLYQIDTAFYGVKRALADEFTNATVNGELAF